MPQWVTIKVEDTTDWPTSETTVEYEGFTFLLLPETETSATAVALRRGATVSLDSAITIIRRFLSALAWALNQPIRDSGPAIGMYAPAVMQKEKGPRRTAYSEFRLDSLVSTSNAKAKICLALYREALGLNNTAYQFLAFYKIINVLFKSGPEQKSWINLKVDKLTNFTALGRLKELRNKHADLGEYLFASGRCAVAHAYQQPVIDPDNPDDTYRLGSDLNVIRALAVYLIENELGVPTSQTLRRVKFSQLAGFQKLFGEQLASKLKAAQEPPITEFPRIPNIAIRVRDEAEYESLRNLSASISRTSSGSVHIDCVTADKLLMISITLDFPDELLRSGGGYFEDDGSVAASRHQLDDHRFRQDLLRARALEIWDVENGQLLARSDPYLQIAVFRSTPGTVAEQRVAIEEKVRVRTGADT
jgi:hypothetical protein